MHFDRNSVVAAGGEDIAVNLPTAAANFIWQRTNIITQPDGTQSRTSYPRRYFEGRQKTLLPVYEKALVRKRKAVEACRRRITHAQFDETFRIQSNLEC